jgi:uncharacterized repeat protein (TIGR03943 family)
MRVKNISPSRVARILTLLVYSFFVSWLLQHGKLSQIVHPRMNPWIELSGLLCLALAFTQIFTIDHAPRHADPANFYIPIIFVIAMAFVYVQSGISVAGSVSSGDQSLALESAIFAKRDKVMADVSKGPLPENLVFDDDRYYTLYNRVYDAPAEAKGHKIVLRGFVDKPNGTATENALMIARNMMWCCSADMAEIGFLARGAGLTGFRKGDWVEARGTLNTIDWDMNGDGKQETVPFVEVERIEKVDKGSTSSVIFPF